MEHKRGDTFDFTTAIPDTFPDGYFVGWTVAAQVRNAASGALISTLDTSWLNAATTRNLRLLKIDTKAWPVGKVEFDVQFTRTSDGYVISTSTEQFNVIKDCTQ